MELWDSYGRVGGKIVDPEGNRKTNSQLTLGIDRFLPPQFLLTTAICPKAVLLEQPLVSSSREEKKASEHISWILPFFLHVL